MATHLAAAATALQSECPHARASRRPVGPRQRETRLQRGNSNRRERNAERVRDTNTVGRKKEPPGLKEGRKGEKLVRLVLFGVTLMHLGKIGGGWLVLRAGSFVSPRTAEQKPLLKNRLRKCLLKKECNFPFF